MYHVRCNGRDDAIMGSSNFTLNGLGLGANSNIELNLEVNDRRDRKGRGQHLKIVKTSPTFIRLSANTKMR